MDADAEGYQDDCRIGRTADHCDYLHRTVTQEQCAACWVRWRSDPDLLLVGKDAPCALERGLWDRCRERHVKSEADIARA